jgi:hypothetical protein
MLIFLLFLAAAIVAGVATYLSVGAGKLLPLAVALIAAGLAVGSFHGL